MYTRNRPGLTTDRPKKLLETIKGVSEQKATKILVEGE
jgi:hypothetical protein